MDKLLKKIADLILIFIALLGVLNFLPLEIKGKDLLIVSGIILFILFVALITHHTSKLENEIAKLKERFIREKRLNKLESEIKSLKSILLKNE